MVIYLDVLLLLNFAVNFSLLTLVARLTGALWRTWRGILSAGLGAVYGALAVVPGLEILGALWAKGLIFGVMALGAFGWRRGTWGKAGLFLGLSFAMGGMVSALGLWGFWPMVLGAWGLCALVPWGLGRLFRHTGQLVPVKIRLGSREVALTALRDTGNSLRDPFSGQSVLVVGCQGAKALLGEVDLQDPTALMIQWSGPQACRLIPYHCLGGRGMLLAVRCDSVTIGGRSAGRLVAFSPETLSSAGTYEALTGGTYG